MRDHNYMNVMKKSMVALCAAFACASIASADEGWDFINTFPNRGTWALLDGGKSLPSGASTDDVWVAEPSEDKTAAQGHWRSSSGDDLYTEIGVLDTVGGIVTLTPAIDSSGSATITISADDLASTTEPQTIVGTLAVRDAVTQEQVDEAKTTRDLGVRDAVTQEQVDEATDTRDSGTIEAITQAKVDAAQETVTTGIRTGVSQAEIDNNTFIVQQIEEAIETGFIEDDAFAADSNDDGTSNLDELSAALLVVDIPSRNTDIAGIVADIIADDADGVSDALAALSTTTDTAKTTADTADTAWDITVIAVGAADTAVSTAQDAATTTGMLIGNVDSLVDANAYLNTLSDATERALVQDVITAFEGQADAVKDQTNAKSVNDDALNALIDAQAAVANAVIDSLTMSSDESIANRDAAQKIIDTGALSEITSGDVVSAWRTTVLGVRTEITQEQVDAAQTIVNNGLTVQNASFSLPGMTSVSQELYEYAKAVVKYTEGSLFEESGYSQADITGAQSIVEAGVLETITNSQHTAALTIVENNDVAEAESLLKEGLTAGVVQSDLNDAQRVVDAQKTIDDVGVGNTSRAAVTQATVDKNAELLNLLTYAKEEFGKTGAITFSDEQIDLDTMQAIVELAEAQILVNAGVLTEEVTAEQIADAQAIIDGGVRPEVTAEQIADAQAIVDGGVLEEVTQEQVDAQIEQREFFVQVLNNGVKVENPTQEQIDAAQAKYEEYVATYTAEKVNLVIGIYGLTDEDEDTFLAMVNTYGSIENITKAKAFVNAGGVDAIKALVNTGHIETALYSANDKTTTMGDFITKIQPDVSGAVSGATAGVNAVGGAIGGHQQSVVVSSGKYGLKKHSLSVSKQLGMSSGGGIRSTGAWMKVFGSTSEMDMRDSIAGYDADASGIVVGIDKTFGDLMIGAAISVADIDVDGKSIANSSTDSDQFQGTLYGTVMMDSYYINGSLAIARTSSDTSRIGLEGGVTGSYDTDTYAISLGAGVPIDMGSMAIIPQAVASYTSISPDSYTESGIGALHVAAENMESFGIKAGIAVSSTIAIDGGIIAPKVRLMADWDVTQEKAVVNSSWVGDVDNTVYSTSGAEPASLGAIIGAGVDYASDDGLYVLSLDYDLSKRSDFTSHAGSVKVRVNF